MNAITDVDLSGKRVLIRVDLNVPLDRDQRITDDTRIRAVLPTIALARRNGARIVLASHLGRPKGCLVPAMSLAPVADRLGTLLNTTVAMAGDCVGESVQTMVAGLGDGDVLLLENLRFHSEEQKNDDVFAQQLATLCDIYVNDAFAVSHRAHASVAAICRHVSIAAAGLLLKQELDAFAGAMADPDRPLVAIVGGAKVSSKLAAIQNLVKHVDALIIGGAMANTFLSALGHDMGASLVEADLIDTARNILQQAEQRGVGLHLPVDAIVADTMAADAEALSVAVEDLPEGKMALDIGPATCKRFVEALDGAGTIIWNGPMGVFEMAPFAGGTMALLDAVADSPAMTIVGGGDTDAAVHASGKSDRFTYISTGGGAFLTLLEGKPLPAVQALDDAVDPT